MSFEATRRSGHALDWVNFFTAAMQSGFGAFVVLLLLRDNWAPQDIGFALTISTIASLCSQVPAGALIDAIGDKRHAVGAGILGVGAAALLLAIFSARPAVYLAQALQGLASSLIGPGITTISLVLVGHPALSERIGRNARFASVGNGLTIAVMGFGGSLFEPVWIFWFAAAQSVPAVLCLFWAGSGRGPRLPEAGAAEATSEDATKLGWKGLKDLVTDRRLVVFASCVLLFFVASAAIGPVVAGYVTREYPQSASLVVAAMTLLSQAIVAAISPWIGRSAQRSGRRPLLLFGWGLVPLQAVLYAGLPFAYALVICQILNGFSSAVFGVMMSVVVADLMAGTGRFNLTLGALGAVIAAGASLSTFFGGLTISALGFTGVALTFAAVGMLGFLLLWLGLPETHPAMPQGQL